MSKEKLSYLILKIAVVFPLLYMAWGTHLRPKAFSVYAPELLTHFISLSALLWIISVVLVVLAAFILFEKKPFVPPLIASIYFAIIIALNAHWGTPSFDFYYKDVSIAFASLALAIKSKTI